MATTADDIFKFFYVYENSCILIINAWKLIAEGPPDNKTAFIKIMNKRHEIILSNDDQRYWCIYASLGLGEVKMSATIPREDHFNHAFRLQ